MKRWPFSCRALTAIRGRTCPKFIVMAAKLRRSRVLRRLIELGARAAEPGEFTKRAFLNGRIDLSRAEAVMQLIGATSEAAARASVRQLEGGVTGFVRDASKSLVQMLSLIEACTDFPDEVEELATAETLLADIASLRAELARRCDPEARGFCARVRVSCWQGNRTWANRRL